MDDADDHFYAFPPHMDLDVIRRYREYAIEIGCDVGEGVMHDCIIVETEDQLAKLMHWWKINVGLNS